jgi:FkbM family methyltransferase
MKQVFKSLLLRIGIQLNFTKNLWYKDSYIILQNLIKTNNPVIFDVGGSDGSTVVDFKKIFPNAQILTFEPFPDAFANLNKLANAYLNVKAYNFALSDNENPATFYVNKSKATNSLFKPVATNSFIDDHAIPEAEIQIMQKKLDNVLSDNNISLIDILKIDVQGGELKVLKGAEEALIQNKIKFILAEIWFLEGYENQPLYHDIASYLAKFSFKPFGMYNIHYRKDGHFLWGDAIFYLKK